MFLSQLWQFLEKSSNDANMSNLAIVVSKTVIHHFSQWRETYLEFDILYKYELGYK